MLRVSNKAYRDILIEMLKYTYCEKLNEIFDSKN